MSLPFVVQPKEPELRRIGTPKTGILEFPVYGGLTVGEQQRINAGSQNKYLANEQLARLAEQISNEQKISLIEAQQLIENNDESVTAKYQGRLIQIGQLIEEQEAKVKAITVKALIQCRLKMPDWDDLDSMDHKLFDAIWEFALEEKNINPLPSEPMEEEDLKKPPVANGNRKQLITTK